MVNPGQSVDIPRVGTLLFISGACLKLHLSWAEIVIFKPVNAFSFVEDDWLINTTVAGIEPVSRIFNLTPWRNNHSNRARQESCFSHLFFTSKKCINMIQVHSVGSFALVFV